LKAITTNEEYVRLRIYEGDLPADEAMAELLRLERAQHTAERWRHDQTIAELAKARRELRLSEN